MKTNFNDFLVSNPNCSKFATIPDAETIFNIISKDENIISMIDVSEAKKPALTACVSEIETFFTNSVNPTIDLNDGFTRTAIGRMIKIVLEPFGYRPTTQKKLPKGCNALYFTSATCYKISGTATMRIVRTIEEIPTY